MDTDDGLNVQCTNNEVAKQFTEADYITEKRHCSRFLLCKYLNDQQYAIWNEI